MAPPRGRPAQGKAPPRGFTSQNSNKLTISSINRLNLREAEQSVWQSASHKEDSRQLLHRSVDIRQRLIQGPRSTDPVCDTFPEG
jgi:hypothetical protein